MGNIYCSRKVHILIFAHLLNIDIDVDIAIFRQYIIDMVWKSKKWYRSITTSHRSVAEESALGRISRQTKLLTTNTFGSIYLFILSIYLFIYLFIHSLRYRGSTHYTTNIQNKTQSKNTKHWKQWSLIIVL